jgi:hypothetical protein
MRAIVWEKPWEDDYDDLSSFEPGVKSMRRPLPEPPLPLSAEWSSTQSANLRAAGRLNRTRWLLGIGLLLAATVALGASLIWLEKIEAFGGTSQIAWTVAALLAYGLIVVGVCRQLATGLAPSTLTGLALSVGRRDVYPVRVKIIQNGVATGEDDGVVWFFKDALHFKGLETSFVLGAQNLRFDPHAIGVGHGALQHGWVAPTLALRHPVRAVFVRFSPFGRMDKADRGECGYRFRHNLRMFLSHWRESHVPSVYPPLTTQPSLAVKSGKAVVQITPRPVRRREA